MEANPDSSPSCNGEHYDVVVIGSGAGGGPLAWSLVESGLRVLVLEKGRDYPREAYVHDKLAVQQQAMFTPDIESDPHTLVTRQTTEPIRTSLGWIASCVGGGTVHLGGYYYRFHPDDFRMAEKYGDYQQLADWPYAYADLEPYYTLAEWVIGVSGDAEAYTGQGSRSRDYPMPPLDAHPAGGELRQVMQNRQLNPFPTPRCINSQPYDQRPACKYCDLCAGFGCPVGAKGSVQETVLHKARQSGRCTLIAQAMVTRITHAENGLADGCEYIDAHGQHHRVRAAVVCVSCSAVESARLLLLSASERYPDGLGNHNGLVGKYLQFHAVSMAQARFDMQSVPGLELDQQHPFLGQSVMDYYFLPDGISEINKGGLLRFDMFPLNPLENAEMIMAHNDPPLWGKPLMQRLRDQYQRYRHLYVEVFHDFIPNAGTYMELDHDTRDQWGLPVARIHLDLPAHHRRAGEWLLQRAAGIFHDLGAEQVINTDIGGTSSYLVHGTCRAGNDPQTSVLNGYCQSHQISNLFVVDGSFMPTSGGAPPTLTILANSLRVGEHIAGRFQNGVFT